MKKLVTLIIMVICITTNAQTNKKVSYISPKKDTLILPKNQVGVLIAETWDKNPIKEKRPVIIFADENTINRLNNRNKKAKS